MNIYIFTFQWITCTWNSYEVNLEEAMLFYDSITLLPHVPWSVLLSRGNSTIMMKDKAVDS